MQYRPVSVSALLLESMKGDTAHKESIVTGQHIDILGV